MPPVRLPAEIERQLKVLPTADVAGVAWRDYGEIIVVDSIDEAVKEERLSRLLALLTAQSGAFNLMLKGLGIPGIEWMSHFPTAFFAVLLTNVWLGFPFMMMVASGGLQAIPKDYYEAASLDGASDWQQFRFVTLPLLTPIIAVVMTFSVLFTFTDFQLIYVITRGGPLNATHLMATLSFQRAIPGGALGEGAAIAIAMVPFLLAAILFSYFGLQRRAWQQGGSDK